MSQSTQPMVAPRETLPVVSRSAGFLTTGALLFLGGAGLYALAASVWGISYETGDVEYSATPLLVIGGIVAFIGLIVLCVGIFRVASNIDAMALSSEAAKPQPIPET